MNPEQQQFTAAERRQRIAVLYLAGKYQSEIAAEVGVTQQQVSYDLKAIRAAWLASAVRDFDALKAEELRKIDLVERRAWECFERSTQDKEVAVQEAGADKKLKKAVLRKEGQSGNPAFLNTILTCIERRCSILGLDAPKRFVIDWDDLTEEQEAELAKGVPPEKVLGRAMTA
jgi:hypothetical protein